MSPDHLCTRRSWVCGVRWALRGAALGMGLILGAGITVGGCSEKTRPVKGRGNSESAAMSAGAGTMTSSAGIDPKRPGPSQAERSISQAMEIKRGEDALAAGQADAALQHLKQALTLLPTSPRAAEIHLLMGRAHDQAGAGQQAVAAYEKAVALEPGNPAGHYLLALSYKAAKDYPRAHQAIQKAITLAPMNLAYRFDRVTIELSLGQKRAAEQSFTEYEKRRDDLIAQLKVGGAALPASGMAASPPARRDDRKRLLALAALAAVPSDEKNLLALAGVLGDPGVDVRTAAARALGDSGTPDARIRQALINRVAQEGDANVRKVLREALARLPQPGPGGAPAPRAPGAPPR